MPADRTPIAVFARAPIAGRTKTRLAASLGAEQAAALYDAFLRDTVSKVAAEPLLAATLWAASADDAALLGQSFPLPIRIQPDGELGERMESALREGLAHHDRALVLGSDAPTLPPRVLRAAIGALDGADVVLGPATDGGYYLLGVRAETFRLAPVRWSSRSALADTIACASGRRIAFLPPWYDVDTADDLRLLRAHLILRPRAAPATASALAFDPAVDLQ